MNFYKRFVPQCATILLPLKALLKGSRPLSTAVLWSFTTEQAFNRAKCDLANVTLLSHPQYDTITNIVVNASEVGVGAILQQLIGVVWKPITFFLRQLRPAEQRYSTLGRELLAIHKNTTFSTFSTRYAVFFYSRIASLSNTPCKVAKADIQLCETRHLACITEFTTNIRHIKGVVNHVADTLSRCVLVSCGISFPPAVDIDVISTEQR